MKNYNRKALNIGQVIRIRILNTLSIEYGRYKGETHLATVTRNESFNDIHFKFLDSKQDTSGWWLDGDWFDLAPEDDLEPAMS